MRKMISIVWALGLTLAACGGGVSSDEQARRAHLGLDASIDKAIQLGFDGFNAAGSANIPPQTAVGAVSGTLKITGQVDQGASANKGMRLHEEFVGYSDDAKLVYDAAPGSQTELGMQLQGYTSASGSLSGSLNKVLTMSGELAGTVTLSLTFTGVTQYESATKIVSRTPGTTHVVGTVTSDGGVYQVDVTR